MKTNPQLENSVESGHQLAIFCGGGALYGFKEVGVLREMFSQFEAEGVMPESMVMTGSSAGAVLATAFALRGTELLHDEKSLEPLTRVFKLKPTKNQLMDSERLDRMVRECLGTDSTFEDCISNTNPESGSPKTSVDLQIVVSDVDHKRPILLNKENYKGELWKAVRASSSIPGVFKPLYMRKNEHGKYEFVDESQYKKGSDVFMVVDGSFTSDIPITPVMQQHPNIGLPIALRVNPGTSLFKERRETAGLIKKAVNAVLSGSQTLTSAVPKKIRHKIMQESKGVGSSAPVVLFRSGTTSLLGTEIDTADPEEIGLVEMIPTADTLVPPIGKITTEQQKTLIRGGVDEARRVMIRKSVLQKMHALQDVRRQISDVA